MKVNIKDKKTLSFFLLIVIIFSSYLTNVYILQNAKGDSNVSEKSLNSNDISNVIDTQSGFNTSIIKQDNLSYITFNDSIIFNLSQPNFRNIKNNSHLLSLYTLSFLKQVFDLKDDKAIDSILNDQQTIDNIDLFIDRLVTKSRKIGLTDNYILHDHT